MTDERDESGRPEQRSARNTARDVPLVRGAGHDSEPAPRGRRPAQLPRDPTYEAELRQVELAVLRDPEPRNEPSTKQGGRRGPAQLPGAPPESTTPESPQIREPSAARSQSPEPPSSIGRSVASGTLLSVGAVDPRGKTERTLETPRMFFSQSVQGGEAYFKPGRIPAVTVHQTIETETVKLSDSIDPRRAKTLPRIDRAALERFAQAEQEQDSTAPVVAAAEEQPSAPAASASPETPAMRSEYDAEPAEQIHASLSPFRDRVEPSFESEGVPTRVEPVVARQREKPESLPPEPSAVPTHRDLPRHRIEASQPPPAPISEQAPLSLRGEHSESEGPRPMTASIAAIEPEPRRALSNIVAFFGALLVALILGWLVTRTRDKPTLQEPAPPPSPRAEVKKPAPVSLEVARVPEPAPAPTRVVAPTEPRAPEPSRAPGPAPAQPAPRAAPRAVAPSTAAPVVPAPVEPAPASRKPVPKVSHETIF